MAKRRKVKKTVKPGVPYKGENYTPNKPAKKRQVVKVKKA